MSLTTYWLIGPDNTFAQAEGAARRDELAPRGWTATQEPGGGDRVWMRHEVTDAVSLLPYGALEAWQGRGWQLTVPPTQQTDQGWVVVVPERGAAADPEPPVEPEPEPAAPEQPAAATSTPANKQTEKEQKSGR